MIGWVNFTQKLLNNPRASHKLGETKTNENVENIALDYNVAAKMDSSKGSNPVFNLVVNPAQKIEVNKAEDAKVEALFNRRAASSNSLLFYNVGRMVIKAPAATRDARLLLRKRDSMKQHIDK